MSVDIYENNRPVSFTTEVSIPANEEREFGLTYLGSKKPPTGRSLDVVFFPTSGASECNSSKVPDRQGQQRTGMPIIVGLETQEVPLTAIAIPSVVEVEVQAGHSTVTEMALYNVQEFWTTWFVQGCASRDICKKVTGESEGMTLRVDGALEDKPLSMGPHPCGNEESCLEQIGTVSTVSNFNVNLSKLVVTRDPFSLCSFPETLTPYRAHMRPLVRHHTGPVPTPLVAIQQQTSSNIFLYLLQVR